MTRYYHPKRKAELSLQFFRDKERTPNFTITSNLNGDNWPMTGVDALIFGRNFAESDLLSKEEKIEVCRVFAEARKRLEKQKCPWCGKNLNE